MLVKANTAINEALCVVNQLVCPCCLQPELGQLTGLACSFEVSLHKQDVRLEVPDDSGRVPVLLEFGEMAPMPTFGSFDIYSGLKNCCNVWLFCIACDVELNSVGITLSAGRVD